MFPSTPSKLCSHLPNRVILFIFGEIIICYLHYFAHVNIQFSSVQFSCSLMSDSLWPHGLQHTRPPCPSPTPEVYPNSCPLSRWCHPTISSSIVPFSSCPQSFLASGSFQMSQLFTSGGQNIVLYFITKTFNSIPSRNFLPAS